MEQQQKMVKIIKDFREGLTPRMAFYKSRVMILDHIIQVIEEGRIPDYITKNLPPWSYADIEAFIADYAMRADDFACRYHDIDRGMSHMWCCIHDTIEDLLNEVMSNF